MKNQSTFSVNIHLSHGFTSIFKISGFFWLLFLDGNRLGSDRNSYDAKSSSYYLVGKKSQCLISEGSMLLKDLNWEHPIGMSEYISDQHFLIICSQELQTRKWQTAWIWVLPRGSVLPWLQHSFMSKESA